MKKKPDHQPNENWEIALGHFVEMMRGAQAAHGAQQTDSLLDWAAALLPNHFCAPPSLMHRWAAKKLDAARTLRGLRLNILAPRGNAKSTLGTLAYPLREAVEGREPYIWIVSDTKSQAQTHLDNIKAEITDNEKLAALYPAAVLKARFRSNKIELANGVVLESYGTGQRIRGRRLRQYRPTLIVCDDIQNDDHIVSETRRSRSRSWFHGSLLKAGTASTNVIHLATALHQEAIAVELLKTPGWTGRLFKSILQWPDRTDLWAEWEKIVANTDNENASVDAEQFYQDHRDEMNQGAVLLWPEVEPLLDLMKMRLESGEKTFQREKQNSPINPDFCEFDEKSFEADMRFDRLPKSITFKSLALDPSKGKDATAGDYSAFVLVAASCDGTLFVDALIERLPVHQIADTAADLVERWNPDLFGVEINQFQELLGDEIARVFTERQIHSITPCPIRNHVNKIVRIRRLGPLLGARKIRFRRNSPGADRLVEQLKTFPVGDHDDGPDALEMAVRLLNEINRPQRADNLERFGFESFDG